uniref:Uncharacterized protein n=1 Tax=Craspedostauros australis TaxID=1486917 RepID=A0A7S0F5E0_9STRA
MRKRKPGRDTANEARAKKTRTQPATSSPGPSIAPCVAGDQHNTASAATTGPHFTLLPKKLGEGIAKHDPLRLTSIRTQEPWQYRSKTDILAGAPATQPDIAAMKQDAFHLLETLNGASPMERCVLHIFVCATHRFEDDVMAAARRGDTKPIEELEQSMLLVGSAIHCVPARSLVNQRDLARLQSSMPELMGAADDDVAADTVASTVPSMVVSSPADVAK